MDDRSARELRTRQAEYLAASDRVGGDATPTATSIVVVTVQQTTYPTAAGNYFACQRADVDGVEVEGGPATFTPIAGILYVAVLPGSSVPPVGSKLVADSVDGRWVVRA